MKIKDQLKKLESLREFQDGSVGINGEDSLNSKTSFHTTKVDISLGRLPSGELLGDLSIYIYFKEGKPTEFTLEIGSEIGSVYIMESMKPQILEQLRDFLNYAVPKT